MRQWMKWVNEISEKGQLAQGGNHLSRWGKTLRPDNIMTDEPYSANNESVAGYLIIHTEDIDDAVLIAKKCPILQGEGTSVEIRETDTPCNMKKI